MATVKGSRSRCLNVDDLGVNQIIFDLDPYRGLILPYSQMWKYSRNVAIAIIPNEIANAFTEPLVRYPLFSNTAPNKLST